MAAKGRSGRANRLTGQIGEYLVAAELARYGLIATTFAGNVPHYDIVATDAKGRHVSVQVKASNATSWQFAINRFCQIRFKGRRQIVGPPLGTPVRGLVVVMVLLRHGSSPDRFFILTWAQLRRLLVKHHRTWLAKHDGVRPRNPKSLHSAIGISGILRFENQWETVARHLR